MLVWVFVQDNPTPPDLSLACYHCTTCSVYDVPTLPRLYTPSRVMVQYHVTCGLVYWFIWVYCRFRHIIWSFDRHKNIKIIMKQITKLIIQTYDTYEIIYETLYKCTNEVIIKST